MTEDKTPETGAPVQPEPALPVTGNPAPVTPPAPDISSEDSEAATAEIEKMQVAPGRTEVLATRKGMFGVRGTGDTSGYGGLTRVVEFPAGSQPPFGGWYDQVYDRVGALVPNYGEVITKVVIHRGEITFHVAREHLPVLVRHLRDDAHLRFEFCSSVSGVNYPADTGAELHAVYHLQSMTYNRRLRLEVSAPDSDPHIPSVVSTYPTADWHERETFDMFGIIFDGHPALTRILMPDDWPGHPQRKDYPLGGIPVEYKGATIPPPDQRRSYN
ncbi:NADH-quinone oxidoreductase subunit C [Microlunatus panaciterrae]|uniref:NADH-quinone oxidoreductase subunit C n=1 Tax=Microlunatus panaciterrae TaxID=400768 RepID=A0ABS2RKB7_9ACTN|nr:NADH-quinone oxidoreductase subunit C [Microlunatus panaciterrae]